MIKYVAGFMFNSDGSSVVLIKKRKPEFQKGKLNAVGGKIEPLESPKAAMVREFIEEAGVEYKEWEQFCTLDGVEFIVSFFCGFDDDAYNQASTIEAEEIHHLVVSDIQDHFYNVLPNLYWLIPMALNYQTQHISHYCLESKKAV